jgi:hypothetical protein
VVLVFKWIKSILIESHQKRLDEIAHEILDDFDVNREKQEIICIASQGKSEIASIASLYVPDKYKCPKCNGILVQRKGKYGKFIACNKYPICTYTRGIK